MVTVNEKNVLDPDYGGLCLTRKPGEEIVIGEGEDRVVVRLDSIKSGDRVQLKVRAPKRIPVHRREVFDAMELQKGQGDQDGSSN